MSKKQYLKFKVTPEIDKQIKVIAENLPPIQSLNAKGEKLVTKHSKAIGYDEALAAGYENLPKKQYYKEGKLKGQPVPLIILWEEPRYDNHYLIMYWKYREFGDAGVAEYVHKVNRITEASKKAAESVRSISDIPETERVSANG